VTYTNCKKHINFWAKVFLALGAALGAGTTWAAPETVLHSFCQQTDCADGSFPEAGPIATATGELYGTTLGGGNANQGVIFTVPVTGGIELPHQFQGGILDGAAPEAPLFRDKSGNLFGTTTRGGGTGCGGTGCGTVFERSAGGTYRLRHAFNGADGSIPLAGVIADNAGNLYGTTETGGANGQGTIFKLAPSGILTTLYSFCSVTGCTDGANPNAGLIGDANGNLYGTTGFGGADDVGIVFKIHADGSNYTILHTFKFGTDGQFPSNVSADPSGNLYGTTQLGGANGAGSVFKLTPDGSNYAVLYSFCSLASCADGSDPNGA